MSIQTRLLTSLLLGLLIFPALPAQAQNDPAPGEILPPIELTLAIITAWGDAGWQLAEARWYYGVPIENAARDEAEIADQIHKARAAGLTNVEPFLRAQQEAFVAEQKWWAAHYAAGELQANLNRAPSVAYQEKFLADIKKGMWPRIAPAISALQDPKLRQKWRASFLLPRWNSDNWNSVSQRALFKTPARALPDHAKIWSGLLQIRLIPTK